MKVKTGQGPNAASVCPVLSPCGVARQLEELALWGSSVPAASQRFCTWMVPAACVAASWSRSPARP